MKIVNLIDFKKYNNFQIAKALFKDHGCDPDIAVVMAWHIFNIEPPKNWSKYYSLMLKKWENMTGWPNIPEKYVRAIQRVYDFNKYSGGIISVL